MLAFREASVEDLISGMLRIMAVEWAQLDVLFALEPFRPYIDGQEYEDQPMTLFSKGKWSKHKPIIMGTNEEECVILQYYLPMNELTFRVSFPLKSFPNHDTPPESTEC